MGQKFQGEDDHTGQCSLIIKGQCDCAEVQFNIKAKEKGTVFPPLSNQKMNSYLKELAERCDILKNLTFHTHVIPSLQR
jgi:hypothetical protein